MRTSLIRPCGFALGHLPQRGRLWGFFHDNDMVVVTCRHAADLGHRPSCSAGARPRPTVGLQKNHPRSSPGVLSLICSFFRIGLFLRCTAQEVIHTGAVEVRQSDQNRRRNVPLSVFVIGVAYLGTVQIVRQVLLAQILILPQIPYALIHSKPPARIVFGKSIRKTKCYRCIL